MLHHGQLSSDKQAFRLACSGHQMRHAWSSAIGYFNHHQMSRNVDLLCTEPSHFLPCCSSTPVTLQQPIQVTAHCFKSNSPKDGGTTWMSIVPIWIDSVSGLPASSARCQLIVLYRRTIAQALSLPITKTNGVWCKFWRFRYLHDALE